MQKLFASDFDGTLHFWDTHDLYLVSPADEQAILEFQQAGGLFGVCTGRPLDSIVADVRGKIGFTFDFYIAMSGAQVFDGSLQPILDKTLPRELVRELYETYGSIAAKDKSALICADHTSWALTERRSWLGLYRAESFDEIPEPFCGLAMMVSTQEEAARITEEVNSRYAGQVAAYQNDRSIDMQAPGCSKGLGLKIAAEHLGADLTAGIGDSFNDVPMLDAADVAYTFNSSAPDVQAHAQVLVDSAAEAIRSFMRR